MAIDIEFVYEKYAAYVTRLHRDLDAMPNGPVANSYRVSLLSFEDFARMWDRWGGREGLREHWLRRFVDGYDRDAAVIRKRLEQALTGSTAMATNDKTAA